MEGFYDPSEASPLAGKSKLEKHEYQIIEPFMRVFFQT